VPDSKKGGVAGELAILILLVAVYRRLEKKEEWANQGPLEKGTADKNEDLSFIC